MEPQQDQPTEQVKCESITASLKDLADVILADKRVKQGMVILVTEDDDYTVVKGHFYDNAVLLNSIVRDYKEKIYNEVFHSNATD